MRMVFVKTQDFREFEADILRIIKGIRQNAITIILGTLISYLILISLIVLIP